MLLFTCVDRRPILYYNRANIKRAIAHLLSEKLSALPSEGGLGKIMKMRSCQCCNGTGEKVREEYTFEGETYPRKVFVCGPCDGRGTFEEPDQDAIAKAITGRHGLRKAPPRAYDGDWRPYYVWCMLRFDLIPPKARYMIDGDPWLAELCVMAAYLAPILWNERSVNWKSIAPCEPRAGEEIKRLQ